MEQVLLKALGMEGKNVQRLDVVLAVGQTPRVEVTVEGQPGRRFFDIRLFEITSWTDKGA